MSNTVTKNVHDTATFNCQDFFTNASRKQCHVNRSILLTNYMYIQVCATNNFKFI